MTPDDWQRVKEIFQAALDLPRSERAEYVRTAAAHDTDLRREVESLLASADDSEEFLSGPAADYVPGAMEDDEAPDTNLGRRIGPYQILREIGTGGMGSVYLAERVDEFRQKVALKLMRRDMDSRMVISRFRYERQILAGLDHPNIARLLDGGATDDGRPYFVMEFVEGTPLDVYCRRNALPVRRRLELFRLVCAAVQYAHQNLVVHRDIKPGNILVSEDGVPKLLDFGIAKLLRQEAPRETALTQVGMRLMTPEYASPEQVRGLPITTATDQYSLGVLLYEVLVGKMPYTFATQSALELDRVICETDPPRPSAAAGAPVAKSLEGDLDRIVLKSIEKDPKLRYASVDLFSEDIRRHLEGVPVMARPHTLMYRASKFVRRNRTAVAAVVLVVLSLAIGLAAAAWEARRAERRFNDVRRIAGSFLFEFDEKIRDLAGSTPARRLIVERALEYLRSLSLEAGHDASLQRELAEAYLKVGQVQGDPYVSNLGDTAGALASYRQALSISEDVLRRNSSDLAAVIYVARAHRAIGEVLPLRGDAAGAVPHLKASIALLEATPAASHDLPAQSELSTCYEMLGDVMGRSGIENLSNPKAARAAFQKALLVLESILVEHPDNVRARRGTAVVRMKIGDLELDSGEMDEGVRDYEAAASVFHSLSAADPDNAALRRNVNTTERKLGFALASQGHVEAALEQYSKIAARQRKRIAGDPTDQQARVDYGVTLKEIGDIESKRGDSVKALAAWRQVLDLLRPLSESEPGNALVRSRYAEMLVNVGDTLAGMHQNDEALRLCREGLKMMKELADRSGATPDDMMSYAENLLDCPLKQLQNPAAAVTYARKAVELTNESVPDYLEQLARAYFETGNAEAAVRFEQKAVSILAPSAARKSAEELLGRFQSALRQK